MLEARGLEDSLAASVNQLDPARVIRNLSDARDVDFAAELLDFLRTTRACCKQQLEIFAAVERERERVGFFQTGKLEQGVERKALGLDARADSALAADVGQVG